MTLNGRESLAEVLRLAEDKLWVDFERSGILRHRGLIGTGRENALVAFLNDRLPSRFRCANGEIVDAAGLRSGQIDILIFDNLNTVPLLTEESGTVLIGAEGVLALIEVKSTLTSNDLTTTARSIAKVRAMRPWGQTWARARPRGMSSDGGPRCFASIFAYNSDLSDDNWTLKELERLRRICSAERVPCEFIDRVAVLTHGLLIPAEGRAAPNTDGRHTLGWWYMSLLNFLSREAARRDSFPWSYYESRAEQHWAAVLPPEFTAPAPVKFSKTQQRKYPAVGGQDLE